MGLEGDVSATQGRSGAPARSLTVVFVSTMPPDRGNLAEYGDYLARALSQCGGVEHVHVLANIVKGAPDVERINKRLTVHRVWKLGSTTSILKLPLHAKKLGPDIVHINAGIRTWGVSRISCFAGAGLSWAMRMVAPHVVTTLHTIGDTVRLDRMGAQIGMVTRFGIHLATRLYLKSSLVTVTLKSMQRALAKNFQAKNVVHIAHGSYGARVDQIKVTGPTIFSFGFWGAFKDAGLLVRALDAVKQRGINANLVLGGGAHPYYPEIYQQLKETYADRPDITFTGYIPESKLREHFVSAAAVVMPYRTNAGASGVLNLTRSYGRPVVVSDDDGLLEQLRDEGGAGLVFQTEQGLVNALVRLLRDDALQKDMGEANISVARAVTIGDQASKMVSFYGMLARGSDLHPWVSVPEHQDFHGLLEPDPDGATLLQWAPGGISRKKLQEREAQNVIPLKKTAQGG